MSTICLYGAASSRIDDDYVEEVYLLGQEMGKRGFRMIYGAGASGLMGAAARGMTSVGGYVIGVTPRFMHKFEPIFDCSEIIDTKTMARRKEVMEETADAFIVVPGGVGTFDEFFQILTLKELGQLGNKPIVLFNVNGYYDKLFDMMLHSNEQGFLRPALMSMFHVITDREEALDIIEKELRENEETAGTVST